MRGGRMRTAAAALAAAALVAACGGDDGSAGKGAPAAKGKVLRGETETGMKLKVETFVSPASDPELKKLDAWRAEHRYAPVDYHRVTADNTDGAVADRDRTVDFAASADAIASGQGIESRFACDALRYEWLPRDGGPQKIDYDALRRQMCPVSPDSPDAIAPGKEVVYYLITDRGFEQRGLERMHVFGPRSEELR
jgi:hypothetical protein